MRGDVAQHADVAGIRINLNLREVRAERVDHVIRTSGAYGRFHLNLPRAFG